MFNNKYADNRIRSNNCPIKILKEKRMERTAEKAKRRKKKKKKWQKGIVQRGYGRKGATILHARLTSLTEIKERTCEKKCRENGQKTGQDREKEKDKDNDMLY